ncbi:MULTISPECIES: magnesium transporter MgtE N-terminal domain-containing protein [unclassified Mumia]|uniref:magnesium transporter MgtE N-terminal domain-containing protein n=1 Tax=unclassified Mumia TaxID=2621872 RepID=UPI002609A2AF|nr:MULTISPECIES: CBS domain-containing protein [unclassified Mumia]MDD9347294.1 CBS domain-containing protein [Mumia sp.]
MTSTSRIFLARLAGHSVFDPAGDQVGKLRDVVVTQRSAGRLPRVLGLVIEVLGRRRVFLPMTRVTSLEGGQIITTGVLNLRRFEQRQTETLVFGELFDRKVRVPSQNLDGVVVYDVAMEQDRTKDWYLSDVAVRSRSARFGRRGHGVVVDWGDVADLAGEQPSQGATHLLATMDEMRPADLANALRELPVLRRTQIAAELDDERLADVLEEMPEIAQVEILGRLHPERAADVLEEMSPDDAADVIATLPMDTAEALLALMEPEDAEDVRRLMDYEEGTAGGLMTSDAVILPPDATLAEALARIREPEMSPSLAALVYVARPPLETPTGRFFGVVHFQHLLREPPSSLVGAIAVNDIDWPRPDTSLHEVARILAAYNLVACPVVDDSHHLVGAITVDDVLDELLPEGWRDQEPEGAL